MKKIIYSILSVAMLSSCAKVSQEGVSCPGATPVAPIVPDQVVLLGYSSYIAASNYAGTPIIWRGPNNFYFKGDQLYLDFSNATNYGMYTAVANVNGCNSLTDTFYVSAGLVGNPPCTISPSAYGLLTGSNGTSFSFAGGYPNINYVNLSCSGNTYTDISITNTYGIEMDVYMINPVTAGDYYQLEPTCNISGTQAYVTISTQDQYGNWVVSYISSGGNVYCNFLSGTEYITFCSATFKRLSDNTTFTITGNFPYD